MSDRLRITGMVSGMDTDETIKKLMSLDKQKVTKAEAEKVILEWKKEQYQELGKKIRAFKYEFFDVLKPENDIRRAETFNSFSAESSSDLISVKANANANVSEFKIKKIIQLASKESYESSTRFKGDIIGKENIDLNKFNEAIKSEKNSLSFSFDGVNKTIELEKLEEGKTEADLIDSINTKLKKAFPGVTIKAEFADGKIKFRAYNKTGDDGTVEDGHFIKIQSADNEILESLGLENKQSNYLDIETKNFAELIGVKPNNDGSVNLEINGYKSFNITKDDTVKEAMKKINFSSANVKLTFDKFSDRFRLESKYEGSANGIELGENGDKLISGLKLDKNNEAKDAKFIVSTSDGNDVLTSRTSNKFEINNVNIELKGLTKDDEEITISVKTDVKDAKEKIVKFIDKYNELIETINKKINEKREYKYKPLTKEEKDDMKEEEIKLWEEKAKSGLLANDIGLEKMVDRLRSTFYEKINGVGINMYDIGITESLDYKDRGKLMVDDIKLEAALKRNPKDIAELFVKESKVEYNGKNSAERYKDNGIASRIEDIINDNISSSYEKGYIIKTAGLLGIKGEKDSYLGEAIDDKGKRINELYDWLAKKEENYYRMFARMESMMSNLASQSDWLVQQLGGGGMQ